MVTVAIVDYGLANIRSVVNAVQCFPVDLIVAESGTQLARADKIILPGVGAFDAGMQGLVGRGHLEGLNEQVRTKGKPFLGICLGLQFLLEGSEEGGEKGLGWIQGRCRRFPSGPGAPKVPHMGWNDIEVVMPQSRLFGGLEPPLTFYFVHSFHAPYDGSGQPFIAATCHFGLTFTAAYEKENIFATQFHPEKSQLAGMKLLETFLTKI